MESKGTLLSVVELGGYPDFSPLYRGLGLEPVVARSMRQALALLRSARPRIVVAEFVYGPVYSFRVSSLESLVAGIQSSGLDARLIVLLEREDAPRLAVLGERFPIFATLHFPVREAALKDAVTRAAEGL